MDEGHDEPVAGWRALAHGGHVTLALEEDHFFSSGEDDNVLFRMSKPGEAVKAMPDTAGPPSVLSSDRRWIATNDQRGGWYVSSLEDHIL